MLETAMPLLELLAWLMIAGGLLVLVGPSIGLAFGIKNQVETDPVLLPGELTSWSTQESYVIGADFQDKNRTSICKDRAHEPAGPVPINQS
jgi:hypothetical protein